MKKTTRWSPKTQKALAHLTASMDKALQSGNYRLPSIRSLASDAGVSVVIMHRAVEHLKNEGIIEASPRRGICITAADKKHHESEKKNYDFTEYQEQPLHTQPKWLSIKDAITNDLLQGVYPPGSQLPLNKELCMRYGTCSSTLLKALQYLTNNGKIEPYKRGYKVFGSPALDSSGTIVIIAQHDNINLLTSYSPILQSFFTELEQSQYTYHYKKQIFSYLQLFGKKAGVQRTTTIKRIEQIHTVIGYIVLGTAIQRDTMRLLLDKFIETKNPMAILDNSGVQESYPQLHKNKQMRFFSLEDNSISAGIAIGNHLLATGHKKACYFTTTVNSMWSKNRASGIESALYSSQNRNPLHIYSDYIPTITENGNDMYPLHRYRSKTERFYFDRIYLHPYVNILQHQEALDPLFQKAFDETDTTAWVGANDVVALCAYFYLMRNTIDIPQKIALAGFDNILETCTYGITSYDFNCRALLEAMLDYLFRSAYARQKERITYVKIPGKIMARKSTGG